MPQIKTRNLGTIKLALTELGLAGVLLSPGKSADPDFTAVIPGSSNISHLEANVQYAQAGPLAAELQARLESLDKVFPGL